MPELFKRRRRSGAEALLAAWLAEMPDEDLAWLALEPGPAVGEVAARIAATPGEFLDPRTALVPLVGDVLDGDPAALAVAGRIRDSGSAAASAGAAVAAWVWASEEVLGPLGVPLRRGSTGRVLAALAFRLPSAVEPALWLSDAERGEEAARVLLLFGGQLPAGEDEAAARSLYDRHDSVRRAADLGAALAEHRHRVEIARRLADARAREAAARYAPE